MTLVEQLLNIYPQITPDDFLTTIIVKDDMDGNGPYIAQWTFSQPQPTPDELAAATPALPNVEAIVVDEVQKRLDSFAQERRYMNIVSACTYVNSKVLQFQKEGAYCIDARDAHWAMCYKILADVQAGLRKQPTVDEVLKEMPALIWPT